MVGSPDKKINKLGYGNWHYKLSTGKLVFAMQKYMITS